MCAIAFQFQAYGIYFYGMWEGVGGREEEVGGEKKVAHYQISSGFKWEEVIDTEV